MKTNTPDLVEMLRQMILIREFEELALELRQAGKIFGTVHPYTGEEAVAVGVCAALTDADRVTSTHRGHGHCIAKGANVNRMMAELMGRVDGYCKGKGGSMHIADFGVGMLGANGIVAAGLPIASGAAWAAQLEGKGNVAVAFFGDGAATEGEFHESLNIASVWRLPVVFVCENNRYAANNATAAQHRLVDISVHAASYDMPGILVDGNDVMAVYQATREAVDRARSGAGPSLVECKTYRLRMHYTHQVPPPEERSADEIAGWRKRDPIACLQADLLTRHVITEADLAKLKARVGEELKAAVAFAESSPFPDPETLFEDIFAPTA